MALSALVQNNGASLKKELLIALIAEVKQIPYSTLLTLNTLINIVSEAQFSPINMVTVKSCITSSNQICKVINNRVEFSTLTGRFGVDDEKSF